MVLEADDSLVADSDSEDIRRQIFESTVAFTNGLDMNDPVSLPDFFGDLLKQLGFPRLRGTSFSASRNFARKILATALSGIR
ncbi:hypothetical protein MJD09_17825 [bacterium]|nr:hypothetical protein [bacterium]